MVGEKVGVRTVQLGLFGDHKTIQKTKSFEDRTLVGRFLLLGGGVQSGTLVEMIADGVIQKPDAVIFSDTGDEGWWTLQMMQRYRSRLSTVGVKLIQAIVWDGFYATQQKLSESALGVHRDFASIPFYLINPDGSKGMLRRQCTDRFKIAPANKNIKFWLHQNRGIGKWLNKDETYEAPDIRLPRDVYTECLFGISTDEAERATSERGPNWQKPVYPLMDMGMSRDDCVAWLTERGYPIPRKSACYYCPFRDDLGWLEMQEFDPNTFERACQFDEYIRSEEFKTRTAMGQQLRGTPFLHSSRTPLREAILKRNTVTGFQREIMLKSLSGKTVGKCSTKSAFSCHS